MSCEGRSLVSQQNEVFKKMKKYLFVILVAISVFIFFYFILDFYLLSRLSLNTEIEYKSKSLYELSDDSTQFLGDFDVSLLHSKYTRRNSRIDLVRDKILRTFKSCELDDGLNYKTIWNEVNSVSISILPSILQLHNHSVLVCVMVVGSARRSYRLSSI